MQATRQVPPLVFGLLLLGASTSQTPGQQQPYQQQSAADPADLRSAVRETETTPGARERPPSVQERASVQRALDLYVEGLVTQNADRIPLAFDVLFVSPTGSQKEGIDEVAPFLEAQEIDSIRVDHTLIDGEYGCELTDHYWTGGPTVPIAICLRVVEEQITEIRPYFDRSPLDD